VTRNVFQNLASSVQTLAGRLGGEVEMENQMAEKAKEELRGW
jgi:hypothetical protein